MNINRLKKCSRCHSEILLIHFGMNRKGAMYKTCNNCRDKDKQRNKEYYENNKEKIKEYYVNNKQAYKNNFDKYYKNNKEKHNDYVRAYAQEKWWVHIIGSSKQTDKRRGMDTTTDYIDKEHLLYQREDQDNKCYYCLKIMVSSNRCDDDYQCHAHDRLSIERMNNALPHCKENVVFACLLCNKQRGDRHTFDEFYDLKLETRLDRV